MSPFDVAAIEVLDFDYSNECFILDDVTVTYTLPEMHRTPALLGP